MKNFLLIVPVFLLIACNVFAGTSDSSAVVKRNSVLVIPYRPAMHFSDTDTDISSGSEMNVSEMRAILRSGIIKELNKKFAEVYDVKGLKNDFVMDNNTDVEALYHAVYFGSDSVYPLKDPERFAVKDTSREKKSTTKKPSKIKPETTYINVGVYDKELIPDLAEKQEADYIIFLNEIDINTHFDDCLNLALKIYRRDLKVHYTIFDKRGKQVYGDVAVSHFGSNSNDVNEIMEKNFPGIADYILASFDRATK
jgi:hypothetical protein